MTYNYDQIDRRLTMSPVYRIKIIDEYDGKTNWLNITPEQLAQIKLMFKDPTPMSQFRLEQLIQAFTELYGTEPSRDEMLEQIDKAMAARALWSSFDKDVQAEIIKHIEEYNL